MNESDALWLAIKRLEQAAKRFEDTAAHLESTHNILMRYVMQKQKHTRARDTVVELRAKNLSLKQQLKEAHAFLKIQ